MNFFKVTFILIIALPWENPTSNIRTATHPYPMPAGMAESATQQASA